ncbi:MAG: hypothetical protein KDA79_03315 [Planctomycetaceae bacterium]|nr:hypothetical protein [Planctomycetaceae bacterium]
MPTAANRVTPDLAPNVTINEPRPGGSYLGTVNGTDMEFEVEVNAPGAQLVAAKIHPTSEAPGSSPPVGFTELTEDGTTGIWTGTVTIPASSYSCNLFATDPNNLTVTVAVKRDDAWHPAPDRNQFKVVCSTQYIDVNAWCCPWFANAELFLTGPYGEDVDTCRPVRAVVPKPAQSVDITATGSWRHEQTASGTSGPGGYGNPRDLIVAAYQDAGYGSGSITAPVGGAKVNSLMALLQPSPSGPATAILDIGASTSGLDVSSSRGIFFGMWDGYQWNPGISNSGTVTATLKWNT